MGPVAFLDANAIYGRVTRSLLMHAHLHDLCRLHWSEQVLDEVFTRLLRNRPDLDPGALAYTRSQMLRAIPGALVEIPQGSLGLDIPDPGDAHVVAGAVAAEAQIIVTANLRHFPRAALAPFGLTAHTPDAFLAMILAKDDLTRRLIGRAIARELTQPTELLPDILSRASLERTAELFDEKERDERRSSRP